MRIIQARLLLSAALPLLGVAGVLGGETRVETPAGPIVVTTQDNGVTVTVQESGKRVTVEDTVTGKKIVLTNGAIEQEVGNGVTVSAWQFFVKRGDKVIAQVRPEQGTSPPCPVATPPDAQQINVGVAPSPPPETLSVPTPVQGMDVKSARVVINAPADAEVWVEDYKVAQTGALRQLTTPSVLELGRAYHYTVKARWSDKGQTITVEQRASVRAGHSTLVDFGRTLAPPGMSF